MTNFLATAFRSGLMGIEHVLALAGKAPLASPALTGVPTAPTATAGTNTTQLATLAFVIAEILARRGVANGVASLDSGGLVPASQLPAIAITVPNVVASQAAMLALTAEQGDIAIRTDLNRTFVLATNSPTTLADWKELLTPTDALLSIAGLTGSPTAAQVKTALAITVADITNASANGRSLISAANYAAMKALLDLEIGVDLQAYDANTAKFNVTQLWSKPQRSTITPLTSGLTVTLDLDSSNDFSLTLAHHATLATPTNIATRIGQKGAILGEQNGTGGFTLAYSSVWKPRGASVAPAIPVAASALWRLDYHVRSATLIDFSIAGVGTA